MAEGPIRAGVAELEMHPDIGLATEDGAPTATGFLTPLYVKALVLSSGHDEVALVALDLMGIDRADGLRAAALASDRSGIPADNIVLMCSHTHVAPSMMSTLHVYREAGNPDWDAATKVRERSWVDVTVTMIADAVAAARAQLQDASIGTVTTDLPWLTFNRRFHTRSYGVWTHWLGVPANQAYRAEGPIDPEFLLLVVRDARYQPLCLMWNFSGHNSFNFGDLYSGDLAYTVQQAVDSAIGHHVPTLYAPGCGGDTNYFDYQGRGLQEHKGLQKATEGVTSAIVALFREACTLPGAQLGSRKAALFFAQRDVTRHWWKHDMDTKRPSWVEYGPREVERFRVEAAVEATYQSDVVAMRLGDAALVALPGEMFVQFGLLVKERSPFKRTIVVAYANDYAGYVATREAFVGGSYEVWLTLNARIGREGGYLMVDKAVDLLGELYDDR